MKINDCISIMWAIILLTFLFLDIAGRTYNSKLKQVGESNKFKYSNGIKCFAVILSAIIPVSICIGLDRGAFREGMDTYIAYTVLFVFSIPAILICLHFMFYKVTLSPMGIEKRLWFSKQPVLWDEISNIRYSKDKGAYIVESQCGQELRISRLLEGGGSFIECLNRHLNPSRIILGEENTANKVQKREERLKFLSAIVFLFICLISIVVYIFDALNYKNINMKEYVFPDSTFSILFPKEPQKRVKTIEAKDGRTVELNFFETNEKGYYFTVIFSEYPTAYWKEKGAQEMMDSYIPSLLDKPDIKLVESKNIMLGDYMGKEFSILTNNGQGILMYRMYAVDTRLYQIIAEFKNEKGREEIGSKFLNSFSVLKE